MTGPPPPVTPVPEFTFHHECGWASIALGFSFAILAEAFPVHLLVARANPVLAWTLTALSASGLGWLIADFRALGRRPTRLLADAIDLHVGSRWSAHVPYASIASFREVRGTPPPRREKGTLRAVVAGDPTYVIELDRPLVASGPGGMRREFRRITIAPDDRRRFAATLEAALARDRAAHTAEPATPALAATPA